MSDPTPRVIPAGWYTDPANSAQVRWWSGNAWTDYLAPHPQTQLAAAPAHTLAAEPQISGPPTRWTTGSVWLLALSPIVYLAVYLGIIPQLATLANFGEVGLVATGAMFLPFVLSVIFATVDRYRLGVFGYTRRASVWWMLLTPAAYLGSRALKVRRLVGHGVAPLLAWLATWALSAAVAGIVTVLILPGITAALDSQSLAAGIQQSFTSAGADDTVTCPASASFTIGSTFTCTAIDHSTHVSHALAVRIVRGATGAPAVRIESITPALPR
jgi:hypothetical protein